MHCGLLSYCVIVHVKNSIRINWKMHLLFPTLQMLYEEYLKLQKEKTETTYRREICDVNDKDTSDMIERKRFL